MTANILLIRHASHIDYGRILSGRRPGAPLSAAGEQEAEMLAARLEREPLAAVYASPRRRAMSTAAAIARPRGLEALCDAGLDEIDFGAWTGNSFEALDREASAAWHHWNASRAAAQPPGGEPMEAAVDRADGALRRLYRRHAGESLAVVSHCDIIRGLILRYLGASLDNILRLDVDPASVTRIRLGDQGAHIVSINERATS